MRLWAVVFALVCGVFSCQRAAEAAVTIKIDLSGQRMQVTNSAGESYVWPVSSARSGYVTPRGFYRPQRLEKMHYSRKYHMSPMPHSIFFHGGYAIHGTGSLAELGRPASHGCIRLSPGNAAKLYSMVQREGAQISISGTPPARGGLMATSSGQYRPAKIAARQHRAAPFAYAPTRPAPVLQQWMTYPGRYDYY
jgi:hypothetical protein